MILNLHLPLSSLPLSLLFVLLSNLKSFNSLFPLSYTGLPFFPIHLSSFSFFYFLFCFSFFLHLPFSPLFPHLFLFEFPFFLLLSSNLNRLNGYSQRLNISFNFPIGRAFWTAFIFITIFNPTIILNITFFINDEVC